MISYEPRPKIHAVAHQPNWGYLQITQKISKFLTNTDWNLSVLSDDVLGDTPYPTPHPTSNFSHIPYPTPYTTQSKFQHPTLHPTPQLLNFFCRVLPYPTVGWGRVG